MRSIEWAKVVQQGQFAFGFLECARGLKLGSYFKEIWDARRPDIPSGPYQRIFHAQTGTAYAKSLNSSHFRNRNGFTSVGFTACSGRRTRRWSGSAGLTGCRPLPPADARVDCRNPRSLWS
jgi:hypothetical protein